MNKVVVVLAVIVVVTLGALFFFAGFYMGNTSSFTGNKIEAVDTKEPSDANKLTLDEINSKLAVKSSEVSNKVLNIISSGADNLSTSVSKVMTRMNHSTSSQLSADSLLKEIMASHAEDDECSVPTTRINMRRARRPDNLSGKKVVFIGYFKDTVALQVQEILSNKGYKVHVEESKTCYGESFVFAGPFKKTDTAKKLVDWLKEHDFSEAKVVNVIQDSVEGTLAETLDDDSSLPSNEEKDIPEVTSKQLNNLTTSAKTATTTTTVVSSK